MGKTILMSAMDTRGIRLASTKALTEFLDYMLYYRHDYTTGFDENNEVVSKVRNLDSITAGILC